MTVVVDNEGVAWADVIAPTSGGINMGTIHLVGANNSTPACSPFPFKAPTAPWQSKAAEIECRRCRRILTDRGVAL